MMNEKPEMDGGGEEALLHLQLQCNTTSSSSCTRAVETELSMSDITLLHHQLCELRELVAALENLLRRQKEVKTTPALCSVCKVELNPDSEHKLQNAEASQSAHPDEKQGAKDVCLVKLVDCRTEREVNLAGTHPEKRTGQRGGDQEDPDHQNVLSFVEGSSHDADWLPEKSGLEGSRRENRNRKWAGQEEQVDEKAGPKEKLKKTFKCSVCEKSYASVRYLQKHLRRHQKEPSFAFPDCGQSFTTAGELTLHRARHAEERPFVCGICARAFRTKGNLKTHSRTHTGERPYRCSRCPRTFSHASYVKVHERAHTHERPYECATCRKRFARPDVLRLHLRLHAGTTPYQCTHCGKSFRQLSNLLSHERTHTGEKPHLCPDCGRGFSNVTHFHNHRRIHTGEKPFQCQTCGKSFRKRYTLQQHGLTHTGERPHRCPLCDKSFSRTSTLKQHQRVHSGERPYQCGVCQEKFSFLSSLHQHRKKHHPDPEPPKSAPAPCSEAPPERL